MKNNPLLHLMLLLMVLSQSINSVQCDMSEDAHLNCIELARKYGFHDAYDHDVPTEDGYILKLIHIPGDIHKTVLLVHGVLDSCATFLLRGRTSLVAALVEKGYNVWLGNNRGSPYSRGHLRLNADMDKGYWDFSVHEMATHDLPTFIDFILTNSTADRLSLIGHSLGNMQFYILGAMKPKYNKIVNVAIAIGPAGFLNEENYQYPMSLFIKMGPTINQWLESTGQEEVFRNGSFLANFRDKVCASRILGYEICVKKIFMNYGGEDLEEFEPEIYFNVIGHYPCSTSRKTLVHLMQLAVRGQFAQFDYGLQKNLEVYSSHSPPDYDLNKVTMKIALYAGDNDNITPLKNVILLRNTLPNVVRYHVMERKKFNHIDFVLGRNVNKYLYPNILTLLDKYTT